MPYSAVCLTIYGVPRAAKTPCAGSEIGMHSKIVYSMFDGSTRVNSIFKVIRIPFVV